MSLKIKHIAPFLLIGIFILPHALNISHFVWVDHSQPRSFSQGNEIKIQNQNQRIHNCEQFFFKVPASDILDLSYREFSLKKSFYHISDSIPLVYYKEKENSGLFLRGPPFYNFYLTIQLI